jgi:hypothetical protein
MTPPLVRLGAEAHTEAGRLARARAVIRDGDRVALDRLEGDAIWVAMPKRGALRRALGRRLCLIWRATFEDASGRTVESRLVPMLVDVPDASLLSWIREATDGIRARVEAESDGWRADVLRVSGEFSAARCTREHAIAAAAVGARAPSQSGLFDRRAEREHNDRARAAAADEQALAERRDRIAAAAALIRRPARLLLVLVP